MTTPGSIGGHSIGDIGDESYTIPTAPRGRDRLAISPRIKSFVVPGRGKAFKVSGRVKSFKVKG